MAKLKENSTILKSTGEEIIATEESVDRKLLLKADKDYVDTQLATKADKSYVDAELNKKAEKTDIPTKVSQLENDKNYVTQEELGDAGYGDMLKSIYDTNNNGKVDIAENAEKLGGKSPDEFMKAAPVTWNDLKGV